jgi:hypothetical protein
MNAKAAALILGGLLSGGTVLWAFTAAEHHTSEYSATPYRIAQNWQDLSPQERARALENYKRFQKLPPQRRQNLEEKYNHWLELPDEEKDRLRRNYDRYRKMNSDEKEEFLKKYKMWQAEPQ